jgi:deoxyadenosine/deoxycytidine kinase
MTAWARLYREEEPEDATLSSAMGVMSGRIEGEEAQDAVQAFPELKALRRLHLTHLSCPDGVLFLDVDPAVSVERIRTRGEDMQVHETREKLEKLRAGYLSVCRFLEPDWRIPARVLDGHRAVEEVTAAAMEAVRAMAVVPEGLLPPALVEEDEEDPDE